nr:MAG TPA: hypothetical protein [Caudoviricetes sp.]
MIYPFRIAFCSALRLKFLGLSFISVLIFN